MNGKSAGDFRIIRVLSRVRDAMFIDARSRRDTRSMCAIKDTSIAGRLFAGLIRRTATIKYKRQTPLVRGRASEAGALAGA